MTAWAETVVRLLAAGTVLLGVLLVVAVLRRGAPGTLPLPTTTDGVDRTVLLLLALVLIAGGVLTLIVGIGQLVLQPGPPPLPGDAVDQLVQRPWLWWVGAGAALVPAVLGLVRLIARLRTVR